MSFTDILNNVDALDLDELIDETVPTDEGPTPWTEVMGDPVAAMARRLHQIDD